MKPIFKQLIADFQEAALPQVVPRDVHFPELPPTVKKAYVLIGIRRSGKTWAMYQHIHELLDKDIDKKHILYLDFSDDRLNGITQDDLQDLLLAYYEINPEISPETKVYFFLDEIHEVPSWEKFIRRLLNTDSITVYLSGSSAKMLSKEIATTLRGRAIVREIFPFSFKEYLRYHEEIGYLKGFSKDILTILRESFEESADLKKIFREKNSHFGTDKNKSLEDIIDYLKNSSSDFGRNKIKLEGSDYFAYKEKLLPHEITVSQNLSTRQKAMMNHHLQNYLQFGGFPESLSLSENLHRELLQDYVDAVLYKDIIERYEVTNPLALKQFLNYCLQNSAAQLSINKLHNLFKSLGYKVGKTSLYDYSDYLNDSYCLLRVPVYNFSFKKSSLKPKKIYPIDTGLISAYTLKSDYEQAARLETAVFLQLRRKYESDKIFYYHTASGKEIDFLIRDGNKFFFYQACVSLSDEKTKAREVNAIVEAVKELPIEKAYIITLEDECDEIIKDLTIQVVPLWKFLLS